ncbi:hypothetical protein AVL59_15430 [Streptomyces griseochromogenes]|uniref:Uncharacterized protein n=1 Tax=Streptomyces griseochromogenes TaxID=68214 RepID=A0A1B1AW70_9ACTN|nr:hypothetical protein AVL59_15430 [Streptomyces griseochromogenes]
MAEGGGGVAEVVGGVGDGGEGVVGEEGGEVGEGVLDGVGWDVGEVEGLVVDGGLVWGRVWGSRRSVLPISRKWPPGRRRVREVSM